MSDEDDSSTAEVTVSERLLTDDDRREARALVGFGFWFGPGLFATAVLVLLGLTLFGEIDRLLGGILLAGFALFASFTGVSRLRQYGRVTDDLAAGKVLVLKGPPGMVYADRSGFTYVRFAGFDADIRVPNDVFRELQDANLVELAVLPTSNLAVEVHIEHGLGLGLGAN